MRDYTVMYEGKAMYTLNERLAIRQGVTDEQLETLKELHALKLALFERMNTTVDHAELKRGAACLEDIEFGMQRAWNFPEDRGMHEWYLIPGCTCPKLDNAERRYPGAEQRIISADCIIHGWDS